MVEIDAVAALAIAAQACAQHGAVTPHDHFLRTPALWASLHIVPSPCRRSSSELLRLRPQNLAGVLTIAHLCCH